MPVFQLSRDIVFPSPELAEPDGLIAVGGDLCPKRIMEAYKSGIFPWYSEGDPILWWTPSPRLILFPEEFYISRRLARTIRQNVFSVSADSSFEKVITNCAEQRSENRNETWITQEMISAYYHLHELGYAHSIECWKDDKLVGGLYGIALDHVFFGESMFSTMSNSSKVALNALVQHAKETGIHLIDCQLRTEHLASLGAREISRTKFEELLNKNIRETTPQQKWRLL